MLSCVCRVASNRDMNSIRPSPPPSSKLLALHLTLISTRPQLTTAKLLVGVQR